VLAEALALLREATPGPWETSARCDYATHWEVCDCGGPVEPDGKTKVIAEVQDYCMAAEGDAEAIAAAVNYLRSHGEAIRELVEADKEYDEARTALYESVAWPEVPMRQKEQAGARMVAARNRRDAALAKFTTEGKQG
jgi:hypothetical protein